MSDILGNVSTLIYAEQRKKRMQHQQTLTWESGRGISVAHKAKWLAGFLVVNLAHIAAEQVDARVAIVMHQIIHIRLLRIGQNADQITRRAGVGVKRLSLAGHLVHGLELGQSAGALGFVVIVAVGRQVHFGTSEPEGVLAHHEAAHVAQL